MPVSKLSKHLEHVGDSHMIFDEMIKAALRVDGEVELTDTLCAAWGQFNARLYELFDFLEEFSTKNPEQF